MRSTNLLRSTRKTECGAKQFLTRLEVRAAPFALLRMQRQFLDSPIRELAYH